MSENGIAWGAGYRRCTEFYMLMKKDKGLGQAGPEFRPRHLFPKILTSSLFHPSFLSGILIYMIASPSCSSGNLLVGSGRSDREVVLCGVLQGCVTLCDSMDLLSAESAVE